MAGINKLQTLAAIMTPAANPRKIDCTFAFISLRKKKTIAAPKVVIRKVKPVPSAANRYGFVISIITPHFITYSIA